MKKVWMILLCLSLCVGLCACGSEETEQKTYTYEIAFVTPSAQVSIDDGAYVEDTWEGIRAFAEEHEKTYRYYEPEQNSRKAVVAAVDRAAEAGAEIIVGYGSDMSAAFADAAEKYDDLAFLLVDGVLEETGRAVPFFSMDLSDAEAGYLAGYAAVTDGCETVGFIAEDRSKESVDYGFGFVQGCQAAGVHWNHYVDLYCSFDGKNAEKLAKKWYEEGAGIIAVCGAEELRETVSGAAGDTGGRVIANIPGALKEPVAAASVKDCGKAVQKLLKDCIDGKTPGRKVLGIRDGFVSLTWDEEQFSLFLKEDYDRLLKKDRTKLLLSEDAEDFQDLIRKGHLYKIGLM